MANNNLSFKQKWKNFFTAVFAPTPLVSIITAIFLLITSFNNNENTQVAFILNVISTILTAVAGAFIKDEYDELSEESMLTKKGQSAVRNLCSIHRQINQLRIWISTFIKDDKSSKIEHLEEVNRHLSTTITNISSSLEDWIDIVPELQQIVTRNKNKKLLIEYTNEIAEKNKELKTESDKENKEKLEKRIQELEAKVTELNPSILPTPSGSAQNFGTISDYLLGYQKICSRCGKKFNDDSITLDSPPVMTIGGYELCPSCRS